jgi:hypothetical protein
MADTPILDAPLGKPTGTVRAYLALMLVGAFTASHVAAAIMFASAEHVTEAVAVLGVLAAEAAGVLGFYFGTRTTSN